MTTSMDMTENIHKHRTNMVRLSLTGVAAALAFLTISFFAMQFGALVRDSAQVIDIEGYYFDAEGHLSLDDIQRKAANGADLMAGDTRISSANSGNHWLWFSLESIDAGMDIIQLELAWIDHISLFLINESGGYLEFTAGDDDIFSNRMINFRKPAFPIVRSVEDSETRLIVLKIAAQGRLSIPLLATSEKVFDQQSNLDHLFYGAIIAILAALGAYNATIFFSLRDNVHFYYMFYIFAFGFTQIIASGIGQQYLWPNDRDTSSLLAHIFLALTNFSITYFVLHFIALKRYSQTLSTLLQILAWISLLCIPLLFYIDYYPLKPILHGCSFLIMALIFPASIYTALKGNSVAIFLFASNIVLFPSISFGLLRFLGFFEEAYWAEHLAEIGIAAEAIILSAGLAYRVNLLRYEKENIAMARALEKNSFAKKLIASKEEERRNIGKALHDSLGHKILSAKSILLSRNDNKGNLDSDGTLVSMLDDSIEEIRDLSHLLYPSILEHLGLEKAIDSMLEKSLPASNVHYKASVSAKGLSQNSNLLLYRATQECVNNLLKHSNASSFELTIRHNQKDKTVEFLAQDNGENAITSSEPGFGLTMLKQQAAIFGGNMQICRSDLEFNQIFISFQDSLG